MPDDPFPVADLQAQLADGQPAFLIDVRDADAFASGHVAGALNRPLDTLDPVAIADEAATFYGASGGPVLTLCGGGTRAGKAAALLRDAGVDARAVKGGTRSCRAAGMDVVEGA